MKQIPLLLTMMLAFAFKANADNQPEKITWKETKQDVILQKVQAGVPAYHSVNVKYLRNDRKVLRVEISKPVIVAKAEKYYEWGYFQFPTLSVTADGSLLAAWQMATDSHESYGKGESGCRISHDGGKTWEPYDHKEVAAGGFYYIQLPKSKKFLTIDTPTSKDITNYRMPSPIGPDNTAKPMGLTVYPLDSLNDVFKGVYLTETDLERGTRSSFHASLYDPGAMRYALGKLMPVVWWGDMVNLADGSILAGIYPMYYSDGKGGYLPHGTSFYRSDDQGHSWKIWSKIPCSFNTELDPDGMKRYEGGFSEPTTAVLHDSTLLCVVRTGNISPMYKFFSEDNGRTWSRPEPFTPNGVLPRLMQLGNGVLALASGRPGIQLRFSWDGQGKEWTDPFDLLPIIDAKGGYIPTPSCGYPCIMQAGKNCFYILYSDFRQFAPNGELRKAILFRRITVKR